MLRVSIYVEMATHLYFLVNLPGYRLRVRKSLGNVVDWTRT
jgi:hypothetical protein